MVSADVHHVPLTVAVTSVHVGRADAVTLHRAVGDLDGHSPAVLGQLVPKLGDGYHCAAGALTLYHARPGLQGIERTAIAACARDIRHRVSKLCRLVGAAPLGCAGAVPARAVDVDVGKLKGIVPVLAHLHAALGGLVAQRGRHGPRASDGQIQLDAAALRHGAGHGLVSALGSDNAACVYGDGQGVVGQGQGLGAAILRLHRLRSRAGAERGGDGPLSVVGQGCRKAAIGRHAAHGFLAVREDDGAARLGLHHHPGQHDAAHRRSVRRRAGEGEGLVGLDFDGFDAVAGGFGVRGSALDGQGGVGGDAALSLLGKLLCPLGGLRSGSFGAFSGLGLLCGSLGLLRGNACLLFRSLSRGGGGFLGLGGSFGAGCGLLCLLGSGGGKALHILKALSHRLPHLNAPLCLADVVDVFFKSFVHRLFTSVGSS